MFLIGGYGPDNSGTATGIGSADIGPDGRIHYRSASASMLSPTWLGQSGRLIYALGEGTRELRSFSLGTDGVLEPLGCVTTTGPLPCHAALTATDIVVASFGNGDVSVHPLDPEGIALPAVQTIAGTGCGPLPSQSVPRAHHILVLNSGLVLSADLGADRVHVHSWEVDPHGARRLLRTSSVQLAPGTGPRDLVELRGGRVAVLGEWACTIDLLVPEGDRFVLGDRAELWTRSAGNAAALALSPEGDHLYSGVRGPDVVAVAQLSDDSIDVLGNRSTLGAWPRHMTVDGDTLHVANQRSDSIASFRIGRDGELTSLGEPTYAPSPAWLLRVS